MIELREVTKEYSKGIAALNGVNIKIEQGEFVFIVGDSGSGKSTFIRLLMKELEPDSVLSQKDWSSIPGFPPFEGQKCIREYCIRTSCYRSTDSCHQKESTGGAFLGRFGTKI